ncbi:hypothetical protein GCM10028803_59820 [Larkinella knui]|uniref:Outer membrane protein beta-barrel domain-containing protein n=1 Tax=Larkinella knui TaxID=2025310 RepID=A0A3P1CAN9_9BACT|nr:hypothetical protein [Larkinella knui]RRB10325.1 hypothetical protein EHT87_29300 [Larkinella knui]
MKKSLTVWLMLLVLSLSVTVRAQTKAVKQAPAKTPAKKPAARPAITPAADRSNSEKLPQKTTPAPPPPPPAPAPPTATARPTRSYAKKSGGSGGYGYQKGDNLLNIGVGLSSYYYGNPIGISYEAGIDKDFSVGAQLDYNAGNYGNYYYNSSRWRYTATYLGVRGSFHVNRLLKLNTQKVDLYAGIGVGYRSFRWNDSSYGYGYDYRSGLFLNYFIGGKYYFTNKVGAFLELGYTGLSSARVGISVKF